MGLAYLLVLMFAFQALLLAVLFVFRKTQNRQANILLSLFLASSSWLLVSSVLYWTQQLFTVEYIHFYWVFHIPLAAFAPLFYFYIRNIVLERRFVLKKDYWHFIPLLYTVISVMPIVLIPAKEKLELLQAQQLGKYAYLLIPHLDVILIALMTTYGIVIVIKFWKIYKGNRDLRIWTRAIITAFFGCVLSFVAYCVLYLLDVITEEQDYAANLLLSIFVLVISYFAFNYSAIFNGIPIENVLPFVKYKKTGLSKNYSLELKAKLEGLMKSQKPHLKSELRLDDLAELLGVSRHHTSQVINEYFNSNFFDFINTYRVKESIKLLESRKKEVTLSEVGYLSGFNNTVSFNKAFKKNTGLTPSKYRGLLLNTNQSLN